MEKTKTSKTRPNGCSSGRKKIIVANWKMNPETLEKAKYIFGAAKRMMRDMEHTNVIVCPPNLYVLPLAGKNPENFSVGVQNIFYELKETHFTGEVSARMAREAGAEYAIIGHSERRAFGETDEIVNKKVVAALKNKLSVILCVGERERDANGQFLPFIQSELQGALKDLPVQALKKIMIAYEPVWAIGKSEEEAMSPEDFHQMSIFIRKVLSDMFGQREAASVPILYGGSVGPHNAADFITKGMAQGLLVGHESLYPEDFQQVVEIVDSI
jgi:triosephosphate isomerase